MVRDVDTLYHGTTFKIFDQIKKNGIVPRRTSKLKGNWSHTVSSNREAVYLTNAYPWHFAASAVSNQKEKGLLLEINQSKLFPWKLIPDEDFLEQATRGKNGLDVFDLAPTNGTMKERTTFYRKKAKDMVALYPNLSEMSLEYMGTVAYYGDIPWEAVTRYVVVDWPKLDQEMSIRFIDSQVSIQNFRFLQTRHKAFTKWLFGDEVQPIELLGFDSIPSMDLAPFMQESCQAVEKVMKERAGLTVLTP